MTLRKHLVTEFALMLVLASVACVKHGTPPLALEECNPAGYISCMQAATFVSLPITDSNLFLTYSSRWTPGISGQPGWDARSLGLGGWSIDVVQRYDKASRLLISGDGSWRLTDGVKLPSGEIAVPNFDASVAYVFDSAGRHVRTVDGRLGTDLIRISYDPAGNLAGLEGSANGQPVHISVKRDSRGVARALSGIDGGTTTLGIDDSGRLASLTDPAGSATRITWNNAGLVETLTDPADAVTRFTYDESHRLVTTTDPDAVVQTFETKASADSLEIRASTKLGRHWSYRAETTRGGIRRTFTARDGTTSSETVDSNGAREIELAEGTRFHIGVLPNPVWRMAAPILTPVVQTRTDGVRSRREIKYNLQPQRGLPYLLAGSVTTVINGQPWTQNFDPTQRTTNLTDPVGRISKVSYDERGRLLGYSAPGLARISYAYNSDGRKTIETAGTAKLARTTRYSYDPNTGEIAATLPDGSTQKTKYDKAGRAVGVSSDDRSTVIAGYDAAGRIVHIQPPGGLNFTLGNSPAGRPTAFIPPMVESDGSAETSSYDANGQLTAVSGPGSSVMNISYDSEGRPSSWTFDQGKRTAFYQAHSGVMSEANDPSGVKTSYSYVSNVPTGLKWSGEINGSVSASLDADGRVARESVNGSSNLDYKYDPAGNLIGVGPLSLVRDPASGLVTRSIVGVIETQHEYDANNQLIRTTTTASGKLLLDRLYARDSLGRIQSVAETTGDKKTKTISYTYDRAGRLAATRVNGVAENYTYDSAGNRIGISRAHEKVNAVYDDRDRLIIQGGMKFSWASNGSLTQRTEHTDATQFVYDDLGALRRAKLADGREIKYLVDADGRRVGREVAGKHVGYLYRIDGSLAAEIDSAGKIISRFAYDDSDHLALVEREGVTYRVVTDTVGSPLLIIDSRTGSVAESINYDAWGSIKEDSRPELISISFAGGLRDPDSGFILFGARDYDPAIGRWTGADPIRFAGGDANLYRYAAADPVNGVDRSGLNSEGTTNLGTPMPMGPPGQGITVYLPEGPGTPINYRPPGAGPKNGGNGGRSGPGGGTGGNPVPMGNPPPPGGRSWSCRGFGCAPFGPNKGGCFMGSCSGGPNGFHCMAISCDDPDSDAKCMFCSIGDPHFLAAESLHFDFQAAGEFLAAATPDGKITVQSRQEPVLGGTEVTFNTAVAANVDGDRIGVYAKEPSFLMVNGTAIDDADVEKRLPHGGKLQRHGGVVNISWPDGTRLHVTRLGSTLNYGINFSPNTKTFIGLFGNSRKADELTGRDGSILSRSDPAFQTKLYRQFGSSWRIKQSESLFHYWRRESTATFTNLNIPSKEVRAVSLPASTRSNAESVCRSVGVRNQPALDDCILDVGITGMPAFAAASVGFESWHDQSAPSAYTTAALPGGNSSTTNDSQPAADQYNIHIGDAVSADRPAKGAGAIVKAGQKQIYSFSAHAGDNIYVAVGPCSGGTPSFSLVKPDNGVVDGVGACRDFGPVTLPVIGTYRIVTRANAAPAHYGFSLRAATLNQFSIKVGDAVSPDHPTGAGIITQQGQRQSFGFAARAGDIVYVGIGPCDGGLLSFDLRNQHNSLLDGASGCHDIERQVLSESGTYHIIARTDQPPARYSFFVHEAPADQRFAVRMPVTVSPDSPAKGAGHITAQGAQQFYDFAATPGSFVHIEGKCIPACSNLEIRATSIGDHGRLGSLGLDHVNFDWKLPSGGRYTIQVRSNGYVGSYAFSASQTKTQRR